jgi:hypothetical protein
MGAPNKGKGRGIAFLRLLVGYHGDKCVTWPFFCDGQGYPVLGFNGKVRKAARVMCDLAHGPTPSPRHQAAHACGNGNKGCVNPNHLAWKTPSENNLDRRKHGTAVTSKNGNRTPLTREQITAIREALARDTVISIARQFNTSRRTVERIRSGWNYDKRPDWVAINRRTAEARRLARRS